MIMAGWEILWQGCLVAASHFSVRNGIRAVW